jgi:hypothetical protein
VVVFEYTVSRCWNDRASGRVVEDSEIALGTVAVIGKKDAVEETEICICYAYGVVGVESGHGRVGQTHLVAVVVIACTVDNVGLHLDLCSLALGSHRVIDANHLLVDYGNLCSGRHSFLFQNKGDIDP